MRLFQADITCPQVTTSTRTWTFRNFIPNLVLSNFFLIMQVFGLLTKPLIRLLIPPRHLSREPSALSEPSSPKSFLEHLAANSPGHPDLENGISLRRPSSLRLLLTSPSRSVHHYWRKFDDGFMRPVFGGRGFVPFVPGSPTESSVPLLAGNENWNQHQHGKTAKFSKTFVN